MAQIRSRSRRSFLGRTNLTCKQCKQTDLIINHLQDKDIPMYRRATIDHIIPIVFGGKINAQTNWQVMCEKCNHDKGNEDWKFYGPYVFHGQGD